MPKILIREVDNTGTVQASAITNTVYIPGNSTKAIAPELFYTKAAFTESTNEYNKECLSYRLALRCLELGLYVVYEGITLAEDAEDTTKKEELSKIYSKLNNKTQFDIRFITSGGYGYATSDMIEVAAKRGDCIALLDHPKDMSEYTVDEPAESGKTYTMVEKVRDFFEKAGTDSEDDSYGAAFTPWFYTNNSTLATDADEAIPASFGYLFAYARAVRNNPTWYAVAGSFRGVISELSGVVYEYTEEEVEMLQARGVEGMVDLGTGDTPFAETDNVGKAINAICYQGLSFGYLIWGNRTFRTNDANYHTIATSFLNVRNLISEIKKVLFNTAKRYTFEPNSDMLWIKFQADVLPTLNKMQTGNGILGYRITKEPTTAKARLRARITIIPIEAVEDFELTVELTDSLEVTE